MKNKIGFSQVFVLADIIVWYSFCLQHFFFHYRWVLFWHVSVYFFPYLTFYGFSLKIIMTWGIIFPKFSRKFEYDVKIHSTTLHFKYSPCDSFSFLVEKCQKFSCIIWSSAASQTWAILAIMWFKVNVFSNKTVVTKVCLLCQSIVVYSNLKIMGQAQVAIFK